METRVLIGPAMIIAALCTASFRWPVDNGRITSTFGESRGDHFHDGVDMISSENKVFPIDDGTLIFFWDKSVFPLENHPGAGNYKILRHGGDLYSLYMHLQDGGRPIKAYTQKDILGFYADTGHSYGKHLHFTVLNRKTKASLNPLSLMPKVDDAKAPEILNLYMKIGPQYVRIRDKSAIRLTKHYPVLLEIQDAIAGGERLGLHKLTVQLNGKGVLDVVFSTIDLGRRGLTASKRDFNRIYDEKGYYKVEGITYHEGENALNVSAYDFAGNKAEREFSFTVDLDIAE